jgi:transcription termination factor Rho
LREKYESIKLADLREIAKMRGIKGVTTMKKAEIIDAMCALDEAGQKSKEVEKTTRDEDNTAEESKKVPEKKQKKENASGKHIIKVDKSQQRHDQRPDRKDNQDKPKKDNQDKIKKDNKKEQPQHRNEETREESREQVREQTREPEANMDGESANGILEVMQDGYGFIRCENYLPGENDVYVAPSLIRKFNLKTGDILRGVTRVKKESDKFGALLRLDSINGYNPEIAIHRWNFENMTPVFPEKRIVLEAPGCPISMRIMDLICPIGRGQRGMIVAPPKAGKTTLLKDIAKSVTKNNPDIHLIVLLIDERPEEVTDIKESIEGPNAEVIYSTFDELPDHHKRVAEMVMERAKRLVEHNQHVMILLDSITRLTRAYNLVVPPSGRTLSGGLDPAALHMPKRFFGAARNMREGGSLTILATALIETGSKMDDVIYEEFKGTGNMEIVLDRKLQEKRIFPAINIPKSSTRREDKLLAPDELGAVNSLRKGFNGMKADDAVDTCINMFSKTRNNIEFVRMVEKHIF